MFYMLIYSVYDDSSMGTFIDIVTASCCENDEYGTSIKLNDNQLRHKHTTE